MKKTEFEDFNEPIPVAVSLEGVCVEIRVCAVEQALLCQHGSTSSHRTPLFSGSLVSFPFFCNCFYISFIFCFRCLQIMQDLSLCS